MEESIGMESAREGAAGSRERHVEEEIQPYKIHVRIPPPIFRDRISGRTILIF